MGRELSVEQCLAAESAHHRPPSRMPCVVSMNSRPLPLRSRRCNGTGGQPTLPKTYLAQQRRITRLGYPFRIVQVHDPACSGGRGGGRGDGGYNSGGGSCSGSRGGHTRPGGAPLSNWRSLGPRHRRPSDSPSRGDQNGNSQTATPAGVSHMAGGATTHQQRQPACRPPPTPPSFPP